MKKTQTAELIPSESAVTDKSAPLSFEDALTRLSGIVAELERGELSLESSLTLFEEGVRLARTSQQQLDAAEKRVEELLTIDENGNPIVRDLEPR